MRGLSVVSVSLLSLNISDRRLRQENPPILKIVIEGKIQVTLIPIFSAWRVTICHFDTRKFENET